MFQFRHAKDERLGDEVGMDRRVVGGWLNERYFNGTWRKGCKLNCVIPISEMGFKFEEW